jgi:hypothetical protein
MCDMYERDTKGIQVVYLYFPRLEHFGAFFVGSFERSGVSVVEREY